MKRTPNDTGAPSVREGSASRQQRLANLLALLGTVSDKTPEDLARHLGVPLRTIFRDLALLRKSGLAVELDEQNRTSMAEVRESLPRRLNSDVVSFVAIAFAFANANPHLGSRLSELWQLIKSQIDPDSQWRLHNVCTRITAKELPGFDEHRVDLILAFSGCLAERRALEVVYESQGGLVQTSISPFQIRFETHDVFVYGYSSIDETAILMAVSSITSVRPSSNTYVLPTD